MLVPLTDGNHPYAAMMLELIRTHQNRRETPRGGRAAAATTRPPTQPEIEEGDEMTPRHSEILMRERMRDIDAAARRSQHADPWASPAEAPSWRTRVMMLMHRSDATTGARATGEGRGQALRI